MSETATEKMVPFYLPPPSKDARPEDVANVVAYYAKQAGVAEPTNADYARAGYWSAIGRDNDRRIAQGGCIRGNEADRTWAASYPTLVPAGGGTRRVAARAKGEGL